MAVNVLADRYILRRYCPPTSYSAREIWPKEHTLTAFISSAKTFPPEVATFCRLRRASLVLAALRCWNDFTEATWKSFSSSVERISATPFAASSESVLGQEGIHTDQRQRAHHAYASRNTCSLPGSCRADTSSPSRPARHRARTNDSNSRYTASSTRSVSCSRKNEPCHGFCVVVRAPAPC